jgi:hypothetical protein
MFAFGQQKDAAPRSRELPIGLADRIRPTTPVAGRLLPVPPPLAPLFPDGALRRGTTTTVAGLPGHGATTLALALLAAASQAGSWCAAVGLADPGVVAAAELGIRTPGAGGPRRRETCCRASTSSWCAHRAGPARRPPAT